MIRLKHCEHPGCDAEIPLNCRKCAAHKYEAARPAPSARGYDRTWERLRGMKARRDPWCEMCLAQGRLVPMSDVDHRIPIREAPQLRLDMSNLQSLCKVCHSKKTASGR